MDTIFQIIVLIMSVVVHEVSHGYAALMLGDTTARDQNRLTLNPLRHIDPFGSVILPLLLALSGTGFVFGWAKPVVYNPNNLRNRRWGDAIVAGAGPLTNILVALVLGLVIRFAHAMLSPLTLKALAVIVFINLLLALFNLIPIPPLDGSKILFSFFSERTQYIAQGMEQYGFFILLFFIIFLWQLFSPIVFGAFHLLTNFPFSVLYFLG